ncbi:MAG TPA: LPS assembly protein LptD [Sphingopyxis sp.]|nr:LPS assembly protein LptD [Sphingopyxis sp.]
MNRPLIRKAAAKTAFLSASASVFALIAAPTMVHAQEDATQTPALNPPPEAPSEQGPPDEIRVGFTADDLHYDSETEIVTAEGQVEMNREAVRLRADRVIWNRKTGEVVAEGDVAIRNPEGDMAYGDRILLSDTLRDGVIDNMLVVLENGGRLAANQGERLDNGNVVLTNAAFTPCPVDDAQGCPRKPSWQIRAVRVTYSKTDNKVRYHGARLEVFGLPLIPLPGLSHLANNDAGSGILVPDVRLSRSNGLELSIPYYLRIAPDRDVTITPHIYTNTAPMIEGEIRALTDIGAFRVQAYATHSSLVPLNDPTGSYAPKSRFRGYLDSSGRFQFNPKWSLSYSGRIATDRTFLRRYDINRDDRMRSTFNIERIGGQSYLSISGWATQTLRINDSQGQQPIALPLIDFRQRLDDPLLGGKIELQLNSLALTRTSGQDTQRAFAGARWDWRGLTGMGQEVTVTALVRGDVYHTDENHLTPVPEYRGKEGWQGRGIAAVAADMRWPFIGEMFGGTQTLTPRVQVVATPSIKNISIPNEDARAFDLEDSNLFAINRFNGYDRFEDGTRITYGVEWNFSRPGLGINSIVGQSYRLTDKPSLIPEGTGLNDRTSDIIGRTTIAYKDFLRLTHRFRLDKDNLAVRRNELDANVGSRSTYATIGYSRLNRDITILGEDLRDREEIRLGGRVAFARYWSIFGSTIVDLTGKSEDPMATTDGFEPIRHRLGIAYDDECLSLGFTWRRDYIDTGDARRGNSFSFRIALRNLGF